MEIMRSVGGPRMPLWTCRGGPRPLVESACTAGWHSRRCRSGTLNVDRTHAFRGHLDPTPRHSFAALMEPTG